MNNDLAVGTDPLEGSDCPHEVKDLYRLYRDYLNHEHQLINHRMGWNFTIQGFLFTSYAFVLNKAADIRQALSQSTTVRPDILRAPLHDLQILLLVVAAVGASVSVFVHWSAWAAQMAVDSLTQDWFKLRFNDKQTVNAVSRLQGLPGLAGGGSSTALKWGFHAPNALSLIFVVAWIVLILDEFSIHNIP